MAAAAIPLATTAASAIFGKLFGGPSKQQQAAQSGTQAAQAQLGAAAPQLMGQGQTLTGQGASGDLAAQNYYKSLLGGGRSGLLAATAPETNSALDYYKGAANNLSTNLRGGARDAALANLETSKAGTLAMIPATARLGAAQGLVGASAPLLGAGANATGQGVTAAQGAANAGNAAFNQGTTLFGQQAKTASGFGSMLFDALKQWKARSGGGSGSTFGSGSDSSLFTGGLAGI